MFDLAETDRALLLLLAKTVLKEAGVIQIWFAMCLELMRVHMPTKKT